MNSYDVLAASFLGVLGMMLFCNHAVTAARTFWRPSSEWLARRILLPQIFRGRHSFNPTRIELLFHLVHLVSTVVYNAYKVHSLSQASARASQLATIHIVPLLASYQLNFVSDALGLSLNTILKIHASLGCMATMQSILHSIIELQAVKYWGPTTISGLVVTSALVFLFILLFAKRFAYEVFLYSHRTCAIASAFGLWYHLRTSRKSSQKLTVAVSTSFLISLLWQHFRQIYRNIAWDERGFQLVRVAQSRQFDETVILELRLSRPWNIHPGQHVYLSLLTLYGGSMLQRHPFVITWWKTSEGKPGASLIYIMIDPRRGWTRRIGRRPDLIANRYVWLDGPFGNMPRLEEYGTVMLFASGRGIFAQLPLLKGLTEQSKLFSVKTRRMKLVWQTDQYHDQVQEWVQGVLDDKDIPKDLVDISIHMTADSTTRTARPRILEVGRRVRVIHDTPDIARYIQMESNQPLRSVAVTVSGHGQLRHDVRTQVLRARRERLRLFELDFQPQSRYEHRGGTAA